LHYYSRYLEKYKYMKGINYVSKIPIFDAIRIIPRESEFLDRKVGARGEIFYDSDTNTFRLYNGQSQGGISLAKNDLTNVSNADFLAKANSAGFSGGVQSGVAGKIAYYPSNGSQVNDLAEVYWHTHDSASMLHINGLLEVSGQKNKIRFHWDTLADLTSEVPAVDWHGMVAHAHDTGKLYYAHAGAWVPVASETSLPNSFSTVVVAGQSSVIADSTADTLTLVAGSNITITTNAGIDTVTISSTTSTGSITFVGTTIDSADSSTITFTPTVAFDSDVIVGNAIVFPDGTYQQTSAVGVPGPQGPPGPTGASGAGTGDVLSAGGGYVDNAIIRYDGTTGTIIQNSSATISDAGLLTATSFSGIGSSLTALNATQLTAGTIPDARFPATLPALSGANLTALPATLPAASGVNLTALNATELTSGTVPVLRLGASGTRDATTYLRGDNTWATVAGGGGSSDSFSTIAVAGQSSVVADSATDTLTLVAGTGITITTDAGTDTVTITNSGSASNSFSTVAVTGQSNVVADSSTDTLTIAAGTGISITTDAGTDTVTITSTVAAGVTAFTGLSDAGSLTVDRFYLPAITMLDVTANGISAYRFDQYGTTDDPTIYAINGTTIAFNLAGASSHPFLIQDNTGTNYNTGLVHVTTSGVVTTGASAQGKQSGTLYWKIPDSISGNYRYQCQSHAGMVGTITIKNFGSI
jgi:plastocyanin